MSIFLNDESESGAETSRATTKLSRILPPTTRLVMMPMCPASSCPNVKLVETHSPSAIWLRAAGMPLGLMPGMAYEQEETVLEAGDGALFCSDGLVESRNPGREMFGVPHLRSLLTGPVPDAGDLAASLLGELERFVGDGRKQEDDITLVTLHRPLKPSRAFGLLAHGGVGRMRIE